MRLAPGAAGRWLSGRTTSSCRRDRLHRRVDRRVPGSAYDSDPAPPTRWALAGRNRAKLEQTRSHLETIEPATANLDLIEADIGDPNAMARVAESAKVVITTVGPYIRYGEPLVAACAEAGTDYVDLCGEPEFVDRMWLKYHARATETGARLIHSCGFDSIRTTSACNTRSIGCPRACRSRSRGSSAPTGRSRAAPTTRPSRSSAGCGRAGRPPQSAGGSSRDRPAGSSRV